MKLIARAVPPSVKLDVELARRQADLQLRFALLWIQKQGFGVSSLARVRALPLC